MKNAKDPAVKSYGSYSLDLHTSEPRVYHLIFEKQKELDAWVLALWKACDQSTCKLHPTLASMSSIQAIGKPPRELASSVELVTEPTKRGGGGKSTGGDTSGVSATGPAPGGGGSSSQSFRGNISAAMSGATTLGSGGSVGNVGSPPRGPSSPENTFKIDLDSEDPEADKLLMGKEAQGERRGPYSNSGSNTVQSRNVKGTGPAPPQKASANSTLEMQSLGTARSIRGAANNRGFGLRGRGGRSGQGGGRGAAAFSGKSDSPLKTRLLDSDDDDDDDDSEDEDEDDSGDSSEEDSDEEGGTKICCSVT